MNIRPYQQTDFPTISSWWTAAGELGPLPGMMVEDGSFVLETNGVPAMSITVYCTQSKDVAYLENFIANPEFKGKRGSWSQSIVDHACRYAAKLGYKHVIALSMREKLNHRYQELGMIPTVSGLSAFIKPLKEIA